MSQSDVIAGLASSLGISPVGYETMWHLYWDGQGIASGFFEERMVLWLQGLLGSSETDVNSLMTAYAVANGYDRWSSMDQFFGFSPVDLIDGSANAAYFDPSSISTLFTDSGGTTPVTAIGDFVGLMLDQSQGAQSAPNLVSNGDFDDGTTGWSSPRSNSTLSVSGGFLRSTATASGAYGFAQLITGLEIGKTYKIRGNLESSVGSGNRIMRVSNSSNLAADGPLSTTLFSGNDSETFTATATSHYFGVLHVANAAGDQTSIANVSIKDFSGNHATQITDPARPRWGQYPAGGRRNLAPSTEDMGYGWTLAGGSTSGKEVTFDGTSNNTHLFEYEIATNGESAVFSVELSNVTGSGSYRLLIQEANGGTILRTLTSASDSGSTMTFERTITGNQAAGDRFRFAIQRQSTGAADGDTVSVDQIQVDVGTTTPSAYQVVTRPWDITESGVTSIRSLWFDGIDDFLVTPSIDWSASDAATFAASALTDPIIDANSRILSSRAGSSGEKDLFINSSTLDLAARSAGTTFSAETLVGSDSATGAYIIARSDVSDAELTVSGSGTTSTSASSQGTGTNADAVWYLGKRSNDTLRHEGFAGPFFMLDRSITDDEAADLAGTFASKVGL